MSGDGTLDGALRDRVLERLGLRAPPEPTLDGLNALYRAWCHGVPFDNARKRLAMAHGEPGPLPGGDGDDFFRAWLEHGAGGTCWPSSNGLYELVASCGFAARRASASMRDGGDPNHGTVLVRIDGQDYMADTAMLTNQVFPLRRGESYAAGTPLMPVRIEAVEDSWRIWISFDGRPEPFACRMLEDPVGHPFYLERYEISRRLSPFNNALYARRNVKDGRVTVAGATRFTTRADGSSEQAELAPGDLAETLVDQIGLSPGIVARLLASPAARPARP
jgi:arylamine N-acetyltransferase